MKATIKESLLAAGKQVEAAEHAAMALEKSAEMVHRSAGMMAAVPEWIDSIFVKDASFAERSKRPTHDCTSFKAWFARCKVAWTLGGTEKPELPDYDAEISLFNTVFSWHGTVMPLVFNKPLFWLQLLLHGGLAAWHEVALAQMDEGEVMEGGLYDDADALQWATLSIPSSLVVFFIVFYSSQCYARFFELYGHCVGISGALMCWVALCKINLKTVGGAEHQDIAWNCTRFMLAAQHVVYYGLSQGGMTQADWGVIHKRYLLTDDEVLLVRGYGGFKPLLLITWALEEVRETLESDEAVQDGHAVPLAANLTWARFQELAFELRGHMSQIINLLKQPVPWAYFHILNLMVLTTLTLVAFGLVGMGNWWITLLLHAVISIVFIGMKNIAIAMADPFGDDPLDFNVEKFLGASYKNAIAHFKDDYAHAGGHKERNQGGSRLLTNPLKAVRFKAYAKASYVAVQLAAKASHVAAGTGAKESERKHQNKHHEALHEVASYFTDAAEIQKAHESVRHDDDGHGGTPPESEANEPLVDAMDSIASAQLSGDVVSNAAATSSADDEPQGGSGGGRGRRRRTQRPEGAGTIPAATSSGPASTERTSLLPPGT